MTRTMTQPCTYSVSTRLSRVKPKRYLQLFLPGVSQFDHRTMRAQSSAASCDLDKPQPLQARVPFFADNDVVEELYAEGLGDSCNLPGHLDVRRGRRRIAGGVVVHQDDRGRGELEGALDHLAWIDRSVVDRALLLHLVGDELIALVEKQDAELLLFGESLRGAAIVEHRRP